MIPEGHGVSGYTYSKSLSARILECMHKHNIRTILSVPDKFLGDLISFASTDSRFHHIAVTREEEGVGIAAGLALGGELPVLLLQNSGLGNSVNALISLSLLYRLPLLLIVSHRGSMGETISAQVPMGVITERLIELMGFPCFTLSTSPLEGDLSGAIVHARLAERPVVVLVRPDFWRPV